MRRNPTAAEKKLWASLRRHQLGVQFRRQYPIDHYIVDFAAPSIQLIVEVDGDTHADEISQTKDAERTSYLETHGYRVIRFTNTDVLTNLQAVVSRILDSIPTPLSPPATRGGK